MKIGIGSIKRKGWKGTEIGIYDEWRWNQKAELAVQLMKFWQPVIPDGQNSRGYTLFRQCSPEEIVTLAAEVADLAVETFRTRGWILDLPLPEAEELSDQPTEP